MKSHSKLGFSQEACEVQFLVHSPRELQYRPDSQSLVVEQTGLWPFFWKKSGWARDTHMMITVMRVFMENLWNII